MKKGEFLSLCFDYFIDPYIVLESQSVRDALADKDDERVKELLETEF